VGLKIVRVLIGCMSETYSGIILRVRNVLNKEVFVVIFCVILSFGWFDIGKGNNNVCE
jgi:hypothetical protein